MLSSIAAPTSKCRNTVQELPKKAWSEKLRAEKLNIELQMQSHSHHDRRMIKIKQRFTTIRNATTRVQNICSAIIVLVQTYVRSTGTESVYQKHIATIVHVRTFLHFWGHSRRTTGTIQEIDASLQHMPISHFNPVLIDNKPNRWK